MKIITISIPDKHIRAFEKIKEFGLYPSRSECLRKMIEIAMPVILEEVKELEKLIAEKDLPNVRRYMEERGYRIRERYIHEEEGTTKKNKREPLGNPFWTKGINEKGKTIYVPKVNREETE